MSRNTTLEVVATLAAAYPQRPIGRETVSVYVRALDDLDPDRLEAAARQLVATSTYFPTIAELRGAYFEQALGLPPPVEAWAEVEAAVRNGTGLGAVREANPLAARVAEQIGWSAIRYSDRPDLIRSQFLKAYEAARDRELRAANVGSLEAARPALPAPDLPAVDAAPARALPDEARR